MAKIFISYARKDKDEVYPIVDELEKNGFDYWIDKNGIESGEQFKKIIMDAIDGCEIFLYMLSANTLASDWCQKEYNYAYNNKKIIPVLLKGAKTNRRLMFDFSTMDCIDIYDNVQKEKLIRDLKKWCGLKSDSFNATKQNPKATINPQTESTNNNHTLKSNIRTGKFLMNVVAVSGNVVDGFIIRGTVGVGDTVIVRDKNGEVYYTKVKCIYNDRNQVIDSATEGKYGLWLENVIGNLESATIYDKNQDLGELYRRTPVLKVETITTKSRIRSKFTAEVYFPIFIGMKIFLVGLNSGCEYGPYTIKDCTTTAGGNYSSIEIDGDGSLLCPDMLCYI